MAQREEILNCGDSTYVKRGDTAICILDGFGVKIYDVWKDYYEGKTEKPTLENLAEGLKPDPVLKVTDAIKRASADPEVKNLIVDISNNGGGACCIETLSSAEGFVYQLSSGVIAYSDSTGTVYDAGMPVDISLYLRNEDYSVKEITLTVPEDPKSPEDGSITVTMPDYSAFYDLDLLSEKMNAFYSAE